MLAKLLFPFVDLLCIYRATEDELSNICVWLNLLSNENLSVYPRILIFSIDGNKSQYNAVATTELYNCLDQRACARLHIQVLNITTADSRKELLDIMSYECILVREHKRKKRELFSFTHLQALWLSTYQSVTEGNSKIPNMIQMSRMNRPIPQDLAHHIANVLIATSSDEMMNEATIPLVASCIALDSHPEGMHGMSNTHNRTCSSNRLVI